LRVNDAENIVERFLIHGNLIQFRLDNFRVQVFERGVRKHGHNVGPRSHDFAHPFVAEFHDLLDQVRLFRLDDAFFFRGFHQRFDALFRALLLGLFGLVFRNTRQRFRAFQEYAHRPDEPHGPANQRQKRQQPAPCGAVQQHVRNKVHRNDDFEHKKYEELDERFPGTSDEVHHSSRRLEHQERQPEVPEDSEGPPTAAAIDLQLWLDLRFKDFQMLVDAARSHAA